MAKRNDHTKSRTGKKTAAGSKARKSTTGKTAKSQARSYRKSFAYKKSSGGRSAATAGHVRRSPRVPAAGTPPLEERASLAGFGAAKGLIWMSPDFDEPLEDYETDS